MLIFVSHMLAMKFLLQRLLLVFSTLKYHNGRSVMKMEICFQQRELGYVEANDKECKRCWKVGKT